MSIQPISSPHSQSIDIETFSFPDAPYHCESLLRHKQLSSASPLRKVHESSGQRAAVLPRSNSETRSKDAPYFPRSIGKQLTQKTNKKLARKNSCRIANRQSVLTF
ncbi:hypothetical protein TNCV_1198321 [Trichonephila clavipes]|uniref:Uncharacterized protein n=1 Tax=Trichonephila clavipes TaxID=2585209 RepID=A0A8X6V981_TRICX|nr:hypothetical protein TNCV_1198321 [Trichonephila clavipes]